MRPNIYAIDHALRARGIPIDGVAFNRTNGTVLVEYLPGANEEQRMLGDQLVSGWDQEASDKAQEAGLAVLPTIEDINAATKMADLKAMALALRAYVDVHG